MLPDGPAAVPVREELQQSHRELLAYVARPGSWLDGAERVAIARESRAAAACALCRERKRALSPEHPAGAHDRVSDLPEPLVELAHRVRHDPQRLSRRLFDRTLAAGVSEGAWVEAVGIVALVAGVDACERALGREAPALPAPEPGAPDRRRPPGARPGPGWVATVGPEGATGEEADLYGDAPFVPNIRRALSLVPDHARALGRLMTTHYVPMRALTDPSVGRDLDRSQIELVAARVSALNECFY